MYGCQEVTTVRLHTVPARRKVCWHRREAVSQHDFGEWWALYFRMVPKVFEGIGTEIIPCLLRNFHCFNEIGLFVNLLSHIISFIQSRRSRFYCLRCLMGLVG